MQRCFWSKENKLLNVVPERTAKGDWVLNFSMLPIFIVFLLFFLHEEGLRNKWQAYGVRLWIIINSGIANNLKILDKFQNNFSVVFYKKLTF